MGRKAKFIAAEEVREKDAAFKPYLLTLPSKPVDRKGNKVFYMSLALMPSDDKTFQDTTPAYVIDSTKNTKVMVPAVLLDVNEASKGSLKKIVCETIDSLFKAAQ
jgi:hypothetical protein